MSTELVRRCDQCREPIPMSATLVVADIKLAGTRFVQRLGKDMCSPECFTRAALALYREATMKSPLASMTETLTGTPEDADLEPSPAGDFGGSKRVTAA